MDASPTTASPSVFSHRDFRRYLSAGFLAILAMQIQSVAVSCRFIASRGLRWRSDTLACSNSCR